MQSFCREPAMKWVTGAARARFLAAFARSKRCRRRRELHDLRHTFATMALQNGVDVKTVSTMLGHYSAGFTLDTYAHVTTDAQLKAAQTMGNILSRAV
ncbi:MAG: tyrosine-type recombinase/integrase [Oscillospiraceae bacterium]